MSLFKFVAALVFVYISYRFFVIVGKEKLEDAIIAVQKYRGHECPSNTKLYKLSGNDNVYKIQVLEEINNAEKMSMLRCEKEIIQGNATEDADDIDDIRDSRLFDDACNHLEYATFTPDTEIVHLNNGVLDKFFTYWLEVVKRNPAARVPYCPEQYAESTSLKIIWNSGSDRPGPVLLSLPNSYIPPVDPGEPTTKSEEWAVNTLVQGIFPGTMWCGFGNIAEDVYRNLGEHSQTDACCRAHDLCRPIIRAFQFKYYFQNPSVLPVSHCKCDMDLFNCLKRANSPTSKMIGKIFFNLVKMRCFDFDLRDVCVSRLFGFCLRMETKCAAVIKNNKIF